MSIGRALAMLGAGLNGFASTKLENDRRDREEKRKDEDAAWREKTRQRQEVQWQREDADYAAKKADEDAARGAMAPVEVTPELTPDQQGPQAFMAGTTAFGDPAAAKAAADKMNVPSARMARAAAAVRDPMMSATLSKQAQEAEVSSMALDAARRKEVDDAYNRDLFTSVSDWSTLEQFVNGTKGDGQGGELKIKAVPTSDGKSISILRVGKDGKTVATPFTFENTQAGLQTAVGIIGMRLSPEQKLSHLQAAAKSDEERRRWDQDFGLRKKDSETRAVREERMARAYETTAAAQMMAARAAMTRAAREGKTDGVMTLADLKDGHTAIAKTLNDDYKSQLDDPALDDVGRKSIRTTREREIADVQRLYTGAMTQGMPLTAEQAIAAFRVGKRVRVEVPDESGKTHTVDAMNVNGRLIPLADEPGTVMSAPAAKPPAAAPAPAAAAAPPNPPQTGMRAAVAAPPQTTLGQIEQEQRAQLATAEAALVQAQQQLQAAAKSGDPTSIARYSQAVKQAAAARDAAMARMGNAAAR